MNNVLNEIIIIYPKGGCFVESFFEVIDYNDISDNSDLDYQIEKMSVTSILEITESLSETVTITSKKQGNDGILDFYLGGSLSGHSFFGCSSINCRLGTIQKAAVFSILYSNKAYLPSFFSHYSHDNMQVSETEIKKRFLNDIRVVNSSRKAFENGSLVMTHLDICPNCSTDLIGTIDSTLTESYLEELMHKSIKSFKAEVIEINGRKTLCVRDESETFLDHVNTYSEKKITQRLPLGKIESNNLIELGIIEDIFKQELYKLKYQHIASSSLNSPLISDRKSHIEFLNKANKNNSFNNYNAAMQSLYFDTPIIEGIPIDNIIKLKKVEEDAFENYKISLNKAITSFVKEKDTITPQMIQEFYDDTIYSELLRLKLKVKNTRSLALKKLIGNVAFTSLSLGVGLTTQFVSPEVLKSIGLFTFAGTTGSAVMDIFHTSSDIKSSNYYFIWRLKR